MNQSYKRGILFDFLCFISGVISVEKCYIGVEDIYANPRTLSFPDLSEVVSFKLIDCNKAHYPKETIQVNERRYEFGEAAGDAGGWVCSKVPRDGRIMKDCVPKKEAPTWYVHLQENVDFQGCNGGHCYCDDRDGCNDGSSLRSGRLCLVAAVTILITG